MDEKKGVKEIMFRDEINFETVKNLIEVIDANEDKELIKIYFTTIGGCLQSTQILIEYLNRKHDEGLDIEIVATWEVSSGGFIILCKTKCKKSFLDAWSSIHIGTRDINYRESIVPDSQEKFLLERLEKKNVEIMKLYKDVGLTDNELQILLEGKDVILDQQRLEEILS